MRAPSRLTLLLCVVALATPSCSSDGGGSAASGSASVSAAPSDSASSAASASASASVGAAVEAPPPAPRPPLPEEELIAKTLPEQRTAMLHRMEVMLGLSKPELAAIEEILAKNKVAGQGNPAITEYAMTRKECRERREAAKVNDPDDPICKKPYMVPLWDPSAGETRESAKLCIDRYEFPGIPCEYPMTWITTREAAQLCSAVGKRLCDAHEWEGACAGAVHAPEQEYLFGKPRKEMKFSHNKSREIIWAYGPTRDLKKCATGSKKSKTCKPSGYRHCGSNTYPTGSFPECVSPFGVFDLHGNVAEHMNLPLKLDQLMSRGGKGGETELKGSWFNFQNWDAHEDDCRWRAPDWHVAKTMSFDSHLNYHLGFRCCMDVGAAAKTAPAPAP